MRHYCKDREKLELMKSPVGQTAYGYYGAWMKLQKRSVPPQDRFMNSRQFNHLIKFVEWCEKLSVPYPEQFIKLMVESNTTPALWCRDTTYAMYLQWYDTAYPPEVQFVESLDYLKRLFAEHHGDDTCDNPFDIFNGRELASLVRRRKVSPWLLIVSQKFLAWLKQQPAHMAELVGEAVNFHAFIDKIKKNPELARDFKAACLAEGL